MNTHEITFPKNNEASIADAFPVTIKVDDDGNEPLEVFYLNVAASLNAIVLTPRIKVEICGGGTYTKLNIVIYSFKFRMHIRMY